MAFVETIEGNMINISLIGQNQSKPFLIKIEKVQIKLGWSKPMSLIYNNVIAMVYV